MPDLDELISSAMAESHGLGHEGATKALIQALTDNPDLVQYAQQKLSTFLPGVMERDYVSRTRFAILKGALSNV